MRLALLTLIMACSTFSALLFADPPTKEEAEEARRLTYITMANLYAQGEQTKFIGISVMANMLRENRGKLEPDDLVYYAELYESYYRNHYRLDSSFRDLLKSAQAKRGDGAVKVDFPIVVGNVVELLRHNARASRSVPNEFLLGTASREWLSDTSGVRARLDLDLILSRGIGRKALGRYVAKAVNGADFDNPREFGSANARADAAYKIDVLYRELVRKEKTPKEQRDKAKAILEAEAKKIIGLELPVPAKVSDPTVLTEEKRQAALRELNERYAWFRLLTHTLGEMFPDSVELRYFLQSLQTSVGIVYFKQLAQNSTGQQREAAAFNMYVALLQFVENLFLGEILEKEAKEKLEVAYVKEILSQIVEMRKFLARFSEQIYRQLGAMRDLIDDRFAAMALRLELLEDRLSDKIYDLRNLVIESVKTTALVADKLAAVDDNLLELVGALGDRDLQLYLRRLNWDELTQEQFGLTMDAFHACAVKFARDSIATGPTKAFRDDWTSTSPEFGLALYDLFRDTGPFWGRVQGVRVSLEKLSPSFKDSPWTNPLTWALCADAYSKLGLKFPKALAKYDPRLLQWREVEAVGREAAAQFHALSHDREAKPALTHLREAWASHSATLKAFQAILDERKASILGSDESGKRLDPFEPLRAVLAKDWVPNDYKEDRSGRIPPCEGFEVNHVWTLSDVGPGQNRVGYGAVDFPSIAAGKEFMAEFQRAVPAWMRLAEKVGRLKLEVCLSSIGTRDLVFVGKRFPVPDGLDPNYRVYLGQDRWDFGRVVVTIRVRPRESGIRLEDRDGATQEFHIVSTMLYPLGRSEKILMPDGNYKTLVDIAKQLVEEFVKVMTAAGKDRLAGGKEIDAKKIPSLALFYDEEGMPVPYPYPDALKPKVHPGFVYVGALGIAAQDPEKLKAFNAQVPRQTPGLFSPSGFLVIPMFRDAHVKGVRESLLTEVEALRLRLARSVAKELSTSGSAMDLGLRRVTGMKRLALALERLSLGSPETGTEPVKALSEALVDGPGIQESYLRRSLDWLKSSKDVVAALDVAPSLVERSRAIETVRTPEEREKFPELEVARRRFRGRFLVLERTLAELENRRHAVLRRMK